jgi:hypothetical protein
MLLYCSKYTLENANSNISKKITTWKIEGIAKFHPTLERINQLLLIQSPPTLIMNP